MAAAARRVEEAGLANVELCQADMLDPPFDAGLVRPPVRVLRPGAPARPGRGPGGGWLRWCDPAARVTVIEGDHGSAYFHPDSAAAHAAIDCQVQLQAGAGGDALIGRRVFPLMVDAGLADVRVSPLVVYADGGRPEWAEGFTRRTFAAMVEGVREPALAAGMIDAETFDTGVRDLYRAAEPDGTFSYTFFKGTGTAQR